MGQNVHDYTKTKPATDLSYRRFANGTESKALTLANLALLHSANDDPLALLVGLPVEVMQNRSLGEDQVSGYYTSDCFLLDVYYRYDQRKVAASFLNYLQRTFRVFY